MGHCEPQWSSARPLLRCAVLLPVLTSSASTGVATHALHAASAQKASVKGCRRIIGGRAADGSGQKMTARRGSSYSAGGNGYRGENNGTRGDSRSHRRHSTVLPCIVIPSSYSVTFLANCTHRACCRSHLRRPMSVCPTAVRCRACSVAAHRVALRGAAASRERMPRVTWRLVSSSELCSSVAPHPSSPLLSAASSRVSAGRHDGADARRLT